MTFKKEYYPYEHFEGGAPQIITTSQDMNQRDNSQKSIL